MQTRFIINLCVCSLSSNETVFSSLQAELDDVLCSEHDFFNKKIGTRGKRIAYGQCVDMRGRQHKKIDVLMDNN